MRLPVRMLILLILVLVVLAFSLATFLFGLQLSPLEANKIFSAGCVTFCQEIQDESAATGRRIDAVAIEKSEQLTGSPFATACAQLYPETQSYPYLCWNRNCCDFELPPP